MPSSAYARDHKLRNCIDRVERRTLTVLEIEKKTGKFSLAAPRLLIHLRKNEFPTAPPVDFVSSFLSTPSKSCSRRRERASFFSGGFAFELLIALTYTWLSIFLITLRDYARVFTIH